MSHLLVVSLWMLGGQTTEVDYQKLADSRPWYWEGERANVLWSVRQWLGNYDVDIHCPKKSEQVTIHIRDGGRELYSFEASPHWVFVLDGSTLYLAKYGLGIPGCRLVAYDLKAKKELWSTF